MPLDPLSRREFVGAVTGGLAADWIAADQRPLFDAGLADLNARATRRVPGAAGFAALGADDATALLQELDAEHSPFFEVVRVATISGFLANPEYGGNVVFPSHLAFIPSGARVLVGPSSSFGGQGPSLRSG